MINYYVYNLHETKLQYIIITWANKNGKYYVPATNLIVHTLLIEESLKHKIC
jgi:hypothetical protein